LDWILSSDAQEIVTELGFVPIKWSPSDIKGFYRVFTSFDPYGYHTQKFKRTNYHSFH
jgi:hypothetical protein